MNKKIAIMFPAGCSGNFLANWLTPDDDALMEPNYQLDSVVNTNPYRVSLNIGGSYENQPWSKSLGGAIMDLTGIIDSDSIYWQEFLNVIHDVKESSKPIIVSHILDEATIRSYLGEDWIYITIWPYSNQFIWIKSYINKNVIASMSEDEKKALDFERLFNIVSFSYKTWISQHKQPIKNSKIIDYGDITDIYYLRRLHEEVLGEKPSYFKIKWAEKYISLQGKPITDFTNYKRIKELINPTSLVDLAMLTFIFEMNNPRLKRIWSIDDVPHDFDSAADFLYSNHNNYYQ